MSKINLLPDEPKIDPVLDNMSDEDQVRAYLSKIHTPPLDGFRADVKITPTSKLLGCILQPESIVAAIGTSDQAPFMAAMLAVSDEIDLRIPVPLKR